jgi:hypothetical protein
MERYSPEYFSWLESLNPGDRVYINHPWSDKEVPGGRMEIAFVKDVKFLYSGKKQIHIDGHGVFYANSGSTGYKNLMPYEKVE